VAVQVSRRLFPLGFDMLGEERLGKLGERQNAAAPIPFRRGVLSSRSSPRTSRAFRR
jgi:hypothetical protein